MILDKIVEDKKVRLVEHKSRISPAEMRKLAEQCEAHPASFYDLQNREYPSLENSKKLLQALETLPVRLI